MIFNKFKTYKIELLILSIILVYIFLPTNNSTLDAYGYASSMKYGVDLFKPHHLLYNVLQFIISKFLISINLEFDILAMTKVVNSIFQFFNLYISYRIFKLLKINKTDIILYTIILGFGYSSMRFGTENENYIIPITFSLLASYYYLKFLKTKILLMIFYSGLFASIACLFHQIHFFWWLGIFIGLAFYIKKRDVLFYYIISAIIVPIAYLLVIYFYNDAPINLYNILHFVFHDYYTGSAKSEFGLNNFIFLIISSIRTFFQVHPIIINLIKVNYFFILPLLTLPILLYVSVKLLLKKQFIYRNNKLKKDTDSFIKSHIIILSIHFLFAFYAVGNVEFMVMLPFLLFMSIFYYFKLNKQFLQILAISLFIWNFSYGLIANNMFKHYNDDVLVNFITNHPSDLFLVKNHTVINQYSYKTGDMDVKLVKWLNNIKTLETLKKASINKEYFYTDILQKPQILNRSSMLEKNRIDLSNNRREFVKTYKGLYGTSYIYKVYY